VGLELTTLRSRVACSTSWASQTPLDCFLKLLRLWWNVLRESSLKNVIEIMVRSWVMHSQDRTFFMIDTLPLPFLRPHFGSFLQVILPHVRGWTYLWAVVQRLPNISVEMLHCSYTTIIYANRAGLFGSNVLAALGPRTSLSHVLESYFAKT